MGVIESDKTVHVGPKTVDLLHKHCSLSLHEKLFSFSQRHVKKLAIYSNWLYS